MLRDDDVGRENRRRLARFFATQVAIGNSDLHLGNIGYVMNDEGEITFKGFDFDRCFKYWQPTAQETDQPGLDPVNAGWLSLILRPHLAELNQDFKDMTQKGAFAGKMGCLSALLKHVDICHQHEGLFRAKLLGLVFETRGKKDGGGPLEYRDTAKKILAAFEDGKSTADIVALISDLDKKLESPSWYATRSPVTQSVYNSIRTLCRGYSEHLRAASSEPIQAVFYGHGPVGRRVSVEATP